MSPNRLQWARSGHSCAGGCCIDVAIRFAGNTCWMVVHVNVALLIWIRLHTRQASSGAPPGCLAGEFMSSLAWWSASAWMGGVDCRSAACLRATGGGEEVFCYIGLTGEPVRARCFRPPGAPPS